MNDVRSKEEDDMTMTDICWNISNVFIVIILGVIAVFCILALLAMLVDFITMFVNDFRKNSKE